MRNCAKIECVRKVVQYKIGSIGKNKMVSKFHENQFVMHNRVWCTVDDGMSRVKSNIRPLYMHHESRDQERRCKEIEKKKER